ncbi:MAG TPA: 1-(5-phosphoribosyl)-5-[(5-phosphoribosylamino)methylideneamino] imidazole-4-carboxamide isomerase [Acidimicrobiales bacterium]|nr:1-(5-phosphoribosyl)-5-[(5-phosphoribosylamino)methylideneamino] imidazole-4-carboxamide isomerase [Acidimicrobiales bacterium]
MECFPSIDIRGGQAVRLVRGDFANETVFGDPVERARAYVAGGASHLHLVDLDAARTGSPVNSPVVREIVRAVPFPVQCGGGVRTIEAADALFGMGVGRVVVGTAGIEDPEFARRLSRRYPDRVLVGLDHRRATVGGRTFRELAVRGWERPTGVDLAAALYSLESLPLAGVVVTDISRDGTLEGPDLDGCRFVLGETRFPVIASGGVGSVEDLVALRGLQVVGRSLVGVIVGRALASGELAVADAIAACAA